jgi:hypothetical protein
VTQSDAEIVQTTGGASGFGQLFPIVGPTALGLGSSGSPEFVCRFVPRTSGIATPPTADRSSRPQIRNGT